MVAKKLKLKLMIKNKLFTLCCVTSNYRIFLYCRIDFIELPVLLLACKLQLNKYILILKPF